MREVAADSKYIYPGWTLSAWSLDGSQWSCQCEYPGAVHVGPEERCSVCLVPRPPENPNA